MCRAVYVGEIADIETVDQGEVHGGVLDVEMALEVAGVFHGENHFLLCQIVLAEYVESVFLEVAVEP